MIVTVRHNIEVAHRLLTVPGKCHGLHGHSMWVQIEVNGHPDEHGMVVEFGQWKKIVRSYLDGGWDHASLLHEEDPLVLLLEENGCPVRRMPANPTTENIAAAIGWDLTQSLHTLAPHLDLAGVHVDETRVNAATWRP